MSPRTSKVFWEVESCNHTWHIAKLDIIHTSLCNNLRRLHRSPKNHQKTIVIGQITGLGKIDSFMWGIIYRQSPVKSRHHPANSTYTPLREA